MKIITVLGARPQFIKAAAVSRAIADQNLKKPESPIQEIIVHTGQHFDANMSDVFFDELDIPRPDHHLGIAGVSHGAMTGRMIEAIEKLLLNDRPDLLLVYGDTNSTLAGALAAAKLHIPVAHVEAGLRSHNPAMPEEINRVLSDRVSSLLFCPTSTAVHNLKNEGFSFPTLQGKSQQIFNVGDVMYDAMLHYQTLARQRISLETWGLCDGQYALCTLHRQENTDDPVRLSGILTALRHIAKDVPVIMPLHPRTRNLLQNMDRLDWLNGLHCIQPVSYLEIQRLEMSARVILTDSGGMQKEAFFHAIPCITLRDETEWVETVESGWNQLAGADTAAILKVMEQADSMPKTSMSAYGNGAAATDIVKYIHQYPV